MSQPKTWRDNSGIPRFVSWFAPWKGTVSLTDAPAAPHEFTDTLTVGALLYIITAPTIHCRWERYRAY